MSQKIIYSLLFLLFIGCGNIWAQDHKNVSNTVSQKETVDNLFNAAESLLKKGDLDGAEKIYLSMVQEVPADWTPIQEFPDRIVLHCWNQDEFVNYSKHFSLIKNKILVWNGPLYPKAFYKLAYIASERGDFENARAYLDKALLLEPNHPDLLSEKAYTFFKQKQYPEAYDLFFKAIDSRVWETEQQRARALRGAASSLINLGKLDEAENLYKMSLEDEPGNKTAINELKNIRELRKK